MNIIEPNKPESITIFVPRVTESTELRDFRTLQKFGGMSFGTISQVAKNLGVKMKVVEKGLTFSAPKGRLQMFVEKLHFSMVGYRQIT
jgi:hypothetical protein